MQKYKSDFIDFMIECDALKFGDFTLKSGRRSPFFVNAGAYTTGGQLQRLGEFYARAAYENFGCDFDIFFGPAYKGIPLCVCTTMKFNELFKKEIRYSANRKEIKDHGDAGILLGTPLRDGERVVITEDVTTSGASIEETFPILKSHGAQVKGLVVSLDRMERAKDSEQSALQEIQKKYGFPAAAIVTMQEVIEHLCESRGSAIITKEAKIALDEYYEKWGAK